MFCQNDVDIIETNIIFEQYFLATIVTI